MTTQATNTLTAVLLIAALLCPPAAANDTITAGEWSLAAWTPNDQPVKGAFIGDAASDAIQIRYRINEGAPSDAAESQFVENERAVQFELPKLSYETFGLAEVWAEDSATGARVGEPVTVGIADWREFDISGQTAVELLYPMESWNMQIRFTPCCLINGGYLRVERVPVNPVGNPEGLPASLASEFLRLAPDDTVVATSGLNADIEIDPDSPYADTPESITAYQWLKGRWTPVIGAELHAETNTIRFKALQGGDFVLAPKPDH